MTNNYGGRVKEITDYYMVGKTLLDDKQYPVEYRIFHSLSEKNMTVSIRRNRSGNRLDIDVDKQNEKIKVDAIYNFKEKTIEKLKEIFPEMQNTTIRGVDVFGGMGGKMPIQRIGTTRESVVFEFKDAEKLKEVLEILDQYI